MSKTRIDCKTVCKFKEKIRSDKTGEKYCETREKSHGDQTSVEKRKRERGNKPGSCREKGIGREKDRGNGHGREHRVGNIMKEGTDKAAVDLSAERNKRNGTYEIRRNGHHSEIDEKFIPHGAPPRP